MTPDLGADECASDRFGDADVLRAMFHPRTVAVVGPSREPSTLGHTALATLVAGGFEGGLVAVDSKSQRNPFGIRVYRELVDVPDPIDLAVVATKIDETLDAIERCAEAGVKGVVVLSETDVTPERRRESERQIRDRLGRTRMKLVGPGSCALLNPSLGLNVSAGLRMPVGGNVAFITQSGSAAAAIIDWSHKGIVGLSAFVSLGDMVDVAWGNLIDYFGDDWATRAILVHMESVVNMRAFLSAARAVALKKPIIVMKASGPEPAAPASDDLFDAALRRAGAVRVDSIEDLFHLADALCKQPRPRGPRLTTVSNAAGPDEATSRPFLQAVEKAGREPANDGLLLSLGSISQPTDALDALQTLEIAGKPALVCLPALPAVSIAQEALLRARLPVFRSASEAARTFHYMWRYSRHLDAIYETPELYADAADRELRLRAGALIAAAARRTECDVLSDAESREVLALYGIPSSDPARQGETDHGDRYELQFGSRADPEFGPILWLGAGGHLEDVVSDRVVDLAPLNATFARRMLERSFLFEGLRRLAVRGELDLTEIDAFLVRLSQLAVEQPSIREISINPVLISSVGTIAGPARITLHASGVRPDDIAKPVFRPYPIQYVSTWTTRRGQALTIRPIRAEDEPLMVDFHRRLSTSAVELRYFHTVPLGRRISHEALTRACFIDYDREMVLVVERRDAGYDERQIVAVASLQKLSRRNTGEVAVLVRDDYQRHGLGTELVARLVQVARDEHLDRVVASTLPDNHGMCAVFRRLGFALSMADGEVRAEFDLH